MNYHISTGFVMVSCKRSLVEELKIKKAEK